MPKQRQGEGEILNSLVTLLSLIPQLMDVAGKIRAILASNDVNHWVDEVNARINQFERAKTQDEKLSAVKLLVDSVRGL